jgi:F-type H+-transporting ATPase subunit b
MFLFADADHSFLSVLLDFKSNILNWLILVGFIAWLCAKYLPPVLASRKESIETSLKNAKVAKDEAQQFLAEQRTRVANAEKEAQKILEEARAAAEQMKIEIEKQTKKDVTDMLAKFEVAVENERRLAVNDMRAAVVRTAIDLVEAQLNESTSDALKGRLLNQFMEQLETVNGEEKYIARGEAAKVR